MMSRMINLPWISHILSVVNSNDPSLVGVSGTVLDETKKTILIRTESGDLRLAKEVITFTIDSGEAIEGSRVIQRAEDRIGRRY
ncbi:MAG: ribonuclease P [Euryarchaeota archaeon]|nr:ribonuclease P [Euryarchaeota archaeon]|tara:strand:+ start:2954 stop:3205 length:252 start_codon:yes stop_codon:yes gene_type:complete